MKEKKKRSVCLSTTRRYWLNIIRRNFDLGYVREILVSKSFPFSYIFVPVSLEFRREKRKKSVLAERANRTSAAYSC